MKKLKMTMVLLPLMTVGFTLMASTISVSGGGDALQKAIDKAKAGDVLLVEPGIYSAIDTQGKEIEIRSTKGPKQTFLTGGAQRASLYASVAHLMSDEVSEQIGEGASYRYDVLTEMQNWKPSDLPGSRLVGFTIKPTVAPLRPNGYEDNLYAVEGGRLENCIFPEVYFKDDFAYLSLSVAVNCLFVSGKLDGEIVGDSCLWNCTVVTKAYVCTAELKNTIVYSTGSRAMELDGPCPIYNSIFFNVSGQPSTDPVFADMGHGDYSLAQDSPCIDAGNNAYVFSDADLNGGARIVNGTVDIGAYEYGSTPAHEESAGIDSSYGPFVPGEKVLLTIPALVGYTAKGLPSGLKLDKKTGEITGAAKKPTGDAGVTVTFTKKNEPTLTAQFVVGPIPMIGVTLEGDTEKCKVTGANKAYLVGKKVSLQAKGPKGTAFVGWFKDGEPWPSEEEFLEPKIKYEMMAEDLNLVARFEKEKMSIDASALGPAAFKVGTEVAEGAIVINVETQSGLKSLKASKLPSGLKLKQDKKTGVWSVCGTPKKAGAYEVKLTATAKSGAVESVLCNIVVGETETSQDWSVGTFVGRFEQIDQAYQPGWGEDDDSCGGNATLVVDKKGKVTLTLVFDDGERAKLNMGTLSRGGDAEMSCMSTFKDDGNEFETMVRIEPDKAALGHAIFEIVLVKEDGYAVPRAYAEIITGDLLKRN